MIHNWNSSNHASLSSIVSKLNVKSHFVPLSGTCKQGNCYNRSPMWPSFKPFSTKKQHGFIYMMILDNHLNNSLSFSSCVPSHHHWHKSTVALLNIVWFCAIAIWLWVLKRVSKDWGKYSQGAIWYAFEPEARFCRDDKRKVVLKRLYNVSQKKKKNRTLKQWTKVVGCVTIIIIISWNMINMLPNDT